MKTTQLTFEDFEYERYAALAKSGTTHKDVYLKGLDGFEKENAAKAQPVAEAQKSAE